MDLSTNRVLAIRKLSAMEQQLYAKQFDELMTIQLAFLDTSFALGNCRVHSAATRLGGLALATFFTTSLVTSSTAVVVAFAVFRAVLGGSFLG